MDESENEPATPTRAAILALIRTRPMPINAMARKFGLSPAGLLLARDLTAMRRRGEVVIVKGAIRRVAF